MINDDTSEGIKGGGMHINTKSKSLIKQFAIEASVPTMITHRTSVAIGNAGLYMSQMG